jgi:hypothetical protein
MKSAIHFAAALLERLKKYYSHSVKRIERAVPLRIGYSIFLTALVLSSTGCLFGKKHKQPPPPAVVDLSTGASVSPASTNTFLVTPDLSIVGRVVRVNKDLRFVVLSFPIGQTPGQGTRMNVFRRNEIVGEVRVTDQQRENNAIADIVLGDAQDGDEVHQK